MKDWFFYQEKGKTMGPLTAADMRQRIRDGRLRLFDLVFREGDSAWKMAMEFHEFRDEFKKNTTAAKDRPWIVLQKKKGGGEGEFVTTGPFTRDEVKESILAGKVSYSDYVWRSGFKEWKRIAKLAEFNDKLAKKSEPPPLPPLPKESAEEMLKTVVEMKRPDFSRDVKEEIPAEAVTPDLVQNPEIEHMPPARTERRGEPRRETAQVWTERKRRKKSKPKTLWLDWAIVGILMVSLGVGAFYVSRTMRRPKRSDFPRSAAPAVEMVSPQAAPPPPPPPPPEEPEVSPRPKVDSVVEFKPPVEQEDTMPPTTHERKKAVEKIPYHDPTALFVIVHSQGQSQPRLEIRTDGSPDFHVMVQVIGMAGQVADGPGYYRYLRLRSSGDPSKALAVPALKLPQGRYTIVAETGRLRKEVGFSFGTGETGYKQNVARIRKLYAYAIWKERMDLIRLSQRMEERLIDAVKKKKFTPKGLEVISSVKRGNSANYILFDEWWELKELYDSARRAPSDEPLDRLRKLRERLSTFSVWKPK